MWAIIGVILFCYFVVAFLIAEIVKETFEDFLCEELGIFWRCPLMAYFLLLPLSLILGVLMLVFHMFSALFDFRS